MGTWVVPSRVHANSRVASVGRGCALALGAKYKSLPQTCVHSGARGPTRCLSVAKFAFAFMTVLSEHGCVKMFWVGVVTRWEHSNCVARRLLQQLQQMLLLGYVGCQPAVAYMEVLIL